MAAAVSRLFNPTSIRNEASARFENDPYLLAQRPVSVIFFAISHESYFYGRSNVIEIPRFPASLISVLISLSKL